MAQRQSQVLNMTKDSLIFSPSFHREINQHKLATILSTLIYNIFVKNPEHVKISGNLISDVSDHSSQLPRGQCWKVVQYTSRSLTDLEKWYSHIESEILASDFGCNKFHLFLYGRPFKFVTDSEPLESVFNKPTPTSSVQIQRIANRMMDYDFVVEYRPGKENRQIRLRLTAPYATLRVIQV